MIYSCDLTKIQIIVKRGITKIKNHIVCIDGWLNTWRFNKRFKFISRCSALTIYFKVFDISDKLEQLLICSEQRDVVYNIPIYI